MNALGIDIGGTGIKGAPVDLDTGELLAERFRVDTPRPATPENISKKIIEIVDHFQWKGVVGCGFPTPFYQGRCKVGSNLHDDWIGVHVEQLFSEATGLPFKVINDADAAGMAEMAYGAGIDKPGLVAVITLGTGIGSGLFLDGKLIPNTEFGHLRYKNKPFEKYAADSVRVAEELSYKKWGKRLNKYFNRLELIISPDTIIIGGSPSKTLNKFRHHLKSKAEILPAENKNEAGIIGAALAARSIM